MTDEVFDEERTKNLRNEINVFKNIMIERLVNHFKDQPVDEVIRAMASWIDMDGILELEDLASLRKIVVP